jgi:hypothetical protein
MKIIFLLSLFLIVSCSNEIDDENTLLTIDINSMTGCITEIVQYLPQIKMVAKLFREKKFLLAFQLLMELLEQGVPIAQEFVQAIKYNSEAQTNLEAIYPGNNKIRCKRVCLIRKEKHCFCF